MSAKILFLSTVLCCYGAEIKTVHFMSEDEHTQLVAYLFEPRGPAPHAAIVLLHGRAGPYSSLANGVYNATTLSKRHREWGNFWAERGYYALLADSFSPRGYGKGFPAGSHKDRPPEVSEETVRPLDAYAGLRYLRGLRGVIHDRIGVQGWSNGAMTVLVTMADRAPGKPAAGFSAALAEYPGCGMDALKGAYHAYAPILMLLASEDEEVNPQICERFAQRAQAAGSPLQFHVYPGAGHNYDDPGKSHQSAPANHSAAVDTFRRAEAFFAHYLSQPIPLRVGVWTPIGPAPTIDGGTGYPEPTGGRITCIAADPNDPNTLYIGGAGGGVWKTTDGGMTWTPLTDAMQSLFMGALAVAPSNSQVIYAGTGEANFGPSKMRDNRFNIYSGRGILKSTDGGQTWTQLGADLFYRRTFSRIAVQPDNPDIVYAAVGATAAEGLDGNTGVWKSTDGGNSWTNVTAEISTTVPVSDLLIDPLNSKILFAAFGAPLGSPVNNVYQSTDAGATWKVLNLTGTQSKYGRISLAKVGNNVFAVVAEASATSNSLWGLYKSANSGVKWSKQAISVNDKFCPEFGTISNILAVAGDYHQAIAIDPANPSNVYLAGLCIIGSNDGGNTWNVLGDGESYGPHHDHHALAFDASGLLLNGNDGGIWRLDDPVNILWTNLVGNMATTQFNSIATDPTDPDRVVGGMQDMGAAVFDDSVLWTRSVRGDGGATIIDPTRLQRVYQVLEEGSDLFTRSLDGGFTFTFSKPVVPDAGNENRLWYFPMVADPSNGAHVLLGTYRLWYSSNEGADWTAITAPGNNGWQTSAVITALAYAPSAPKPVYAAADGQIYVTSDITVSAPAWTHRSLPASLEISSIVVNPSDATNLCVSRNTYLSGQVLCSTDSGATWADMSGTIPSAPVLSLAIDFTATPAALYAGSIGGVYASADGGVTWTSYGLGLPTTAVPALNLQGNILTAGTHGRGAWQILTH